MSIELKVSDNDKRQMANLLTECQVLDNLLMERRSLLESKGREILDTNSLSPKLYAMRFDSRKDIWEAVLKPGVISVPTPGTDLEKIKKN